MGVTLPGYFPGELPITEEGYLRYFDYCAQLNINVIRVYTDLPSGFYSALHKYNSEHADPILIFQGIWSPEEELAEAADGSRGNDAFLPEIVAIMRERTRNVVDALMGLREGYDHDVSPWILGLLVGTEWSPYAVNKTNTFHPDQVSFSGTYFTTVDASPFEVWLAQTLDYTLQYTMEQGDWLFPISFVNWVTTDPLYNPMELRFPSSEEDWQNLDHLHLVPTDLVNTHSGYFANEHAYPYYPDFLKKSPIEAEVPLELLDDVTDTDPYFNYIERLVKHYDNVPFVLSEVGLSTSLGMAQYGYEGRHHGAVSEETQGQVLEELILKLKDKGCQGVLVFALLDEYFKKTWNVYRSTKRKQDLHGRMPCLLSNILVL